MIDHGIEAAMKMAFGMFEVASRGTARTEAMLATVKPGDVVVTATEEAMRSIRNRLHELGKKGVTVTWCSPSRPFHDVADFLRRNTRNGPIVFDHFWIDEFWRYRIKATGDDVRSLAGAFGGETKDQMPSAFAARIIDAERRR